jgi:tetratricopeptide (TPR) repeat protein/tRNA A-37 threonylcarbamoyl transferase component Bud32
MSDPIPDVKSVFGLALERATSAERQAYLDAACADHPAVRAEVEALLRALDRAGPFLAPRVPPPAAMVTADEPAATGDPDGTKSFPLPIEAVGTVVAGRYKLLQQIGEGGMGSVWMADQTEPVKRRVAVKLIRAERGTSKTILTRFEAERQAIALMDHPHIARLLDAGTEGGAPFIVMELVKGVPLTEYCDAHKLSIRDRLTLFQQICSAVQHAHQKGVIHRDLKPSNVLVESHDGKPVPKVIDFGLAKAASGIQLTEHTLFTGFGSVMGTPVYMAPEQATFNAVDIDTRADVYALGVILYELLTGTTPLTRETIKKAHLDEMLRLIREQEAPTPSSRLSSAEARPTVAANRQSEPAKLGRFVKGELDWIVLKALSKDRDRRYETATGFARDVERFLNHEPVQAGPPTTGYKLKKFVRRNRAQVIGGGLVVLALVLGIAGTTFGLLRAEKKRVEAEQAEEREAGERKRAEVESQRSFDALVALTALGPMKLIGAKPSLGPNEREYLESVLKLWLAYAATSGGGSRADYYRAQGLARVSGLKDQLGRHEEAVAGLRDAATAWEAVAAANPDKPDYRDEWATTHVNLGVALGSLGRGREAAAAYETAVGISLGIVTAHPDNARYRDGLMVAYANLGRVLADIGEWERAEAAFRAGRQSLDRALARSPSDPTLRSRSADFYDGAAHLAARRRQLPEAEDGFRKSIAVRKSLAGERPGDPEPSQRLANCYNNLAYVLYEAGRLEECLAVRHECHRMLVQLVSQYPAVASYRSDLLVSHTSLAGTLSDLKRYAEAEPHFRAALELGERLAAERPDDQNVAARLARVYKGYAHFLMGWGIADRAVLQVKAGQSLPYFDKSLAVLVPIHRKHPDDRQVRDDLFYAHRGKAEALHRLRRSTEAVGEWDLAVPFAPPAERAATRSRRAMSMAHAGRTADAVAEVESLLADLAGQPGGDEYDMACIYALAVRAQPERADPYAGRALELIRKEVGRGTVDLPQLERDKDLDPLRGRADFQKLLAELEGKVPPKREVPPAPRKE